MVSNQNRRDVSPDGQGGWKVTEPGQVSPTGRGKTQAEAERVAKQQVESDGGGQVYIHNRRGQIRDADTVDPGNESPRRDTKH